MSNIPRKFLSIICLGGLYTRRVGTNKVEKIAKIMTEEDNEIYEGVVTSKSDTQWPIE